MTTEAATKSASHSRDAEALRAAEARVLAMIAADEPLANTLTELTRAFEALADGMLASVLLVERGRVRHGAAPSLSPAWVELVDGEPIGPNRGSCGTAAFLNEPVIVSDIANDERWAIYRDVALHFGYRACWSVPFVGPGREVIGTFAFYYTEPRSPTAHHLELTEHATLLASIAVQHERHRAALHVSTVTALQHREREQLQAVLDVAPSAVAISRNGILRYANPTYVATFGTKVGDEARLPHRDLELRARILDEVDAGRSVINAEIQAYAADGRMLDLLATYRPIEYEGAPSILTYLVDVSGLTAASRAKSLFLANMSHEIRTPMNAILGYAQMLERDPTLGEPQRKKVGVIHASGDHLMTLINDILEMSKIEAGRVSLVIEPFDLRALLRDVERMFAPLVAAKGLRFELVLDALLATMVAGDAGKVRQVLLNLLSNASKFTDDGRITLRASSHGLTPGAERVLISVEDTGAGVAESDLARIFNAFDQAGPGVNQGGTGLGLAISRSFARMMGGDLEVRSAVGVGSTFTFTFIARAADAEVRTSEPPAPMPIGLELGRRPPPKVLIVDDVTTNRVLLDEMLSHLGFDTRAAASGEEAIDLHARWAPDLVLMDLRMPGMGGLEATVRLRALGSKAAIIAITASGTPGEEAATRSAGADRLVRKPYKEQELLANIGEMLGVSYRHATVPPPAPQQTAPASLEELAKELPRELITRLREAALQARASRVEQLASEVELHSALAAGLIRGLADEFRYDALLAALS